MYVGAIRVESEDRGGKCPHEIAHYVGNGPNGHINQGIPKCIAFSGVRADQAVSADLLQVVQPIVIELLFPAAKETQHNNKVSSLAPWNWSSKMRGGRCSA